MNTEHRRINLIRVAFLMTAITTAGCAANPDAKSACELPALSQAAGVNFIAAKPYYIFPKSVAHLTGCQSMWDPDGALSAVITYVEGKAVQYTEYEKSGHVRVICRYAIGDKAASSCPEQRDIATGFKFLSEDAENSLPPFDDLRRGKSH